MKKFYYKQSALFFFLVVLAGGVLAQPYGNDWIKFSSGSAFSDQEYYKIKVARSGICRIPVSELINAHIAVKTKSSKGAGTIDGRRLQIFGRGEEQYLYFSSFSDSTFDDNSYIEFYAEKNNGWFDARMYFPDSTAILNPNQSLFTDTATYFLTWNNSLNNNRIMLETDQSFSNYSASNYFMQTWLQQYKDYYAGGAQTIDIPTPTPEFTQGEGFAGVPFQAGKTFTPALRYARFFINGISVAPTFRAYNIAYGASEPAVFNTVLIGLSNAGGTSNPNHKVAIKINSLDKGSNLIASPSPYQDYQTVGINQIVNTSIISNLYVNEIEVYTAWTPQDSLPLSDRNSIPYLQLKYPHTFDFTNENNPQTTGISDPQYMVVKNNAGSKTTLNITNYVSNGTPILYDLTTHSRINVFTSGNSINAVIPNSGTTYSNCFLTYEGDVINISSDKIVPINTVNHRFINYLYSSNSNADYIILTHKDLWSAANNYKNYRSKLYTPTVVDVSEVYDQFGYGIAKHPLGIRNFVRFAYNKWTSKPPQYMLLLGKSVGVVGSMVLSNGDVVMDLSRAFTPLNLVPTMGSPPSDILLAARCNANKDITPVVAIGRVSARNNEEAQSYLDNKIIPYESNKPDPWMKQIIHLVGGTDLAQQSAFASHLSLMGQYLTNVSYGGNIHWFYKTTTGLQINQTDSITNLINNGVSILNFFGHSSQKYFDISLSDPRTYNNIVGRYPLFVAMGCDAGAIHEFVHNESERSNSEDYVLVPNKGAIAFMGTTLLSEEGALADYGRDFYSHLGVTDYGKPVGYCIKQIIEQNKYVASASGYNNSFAAQIMMAMTLEGDPAVKINTHLKPDITLSNPDISFNPGTVSTDIDSFTVNVNIYNIGKAFSSDTFYVDLTRRFPDGTDTTYRKRLVGLIYNASLNYKMPVGISKGPGINTFSVFADATNKIDEVAIDNLNGEQNNRASADLLITSDLLFPTYPAQYAIIDKPTVTLKATTGDLLAPLKAYTIEIDTTDLFNSPAKLTTNISQRGGIVSWNPSLTLRDSVVYYWRASPVGKNKWKESSFTYINGKKGWSQVMNYQLKGDAYQNAGYSHQNRKLYFSKTKQVLQIYTHPGVYGLRYGTEIGYNINSAIQRTGLCAYNGFVVAVIDTNTGLSWKSLVTYPGKFGSYSGGQYGNQHCDSHGNPQNGFDFPMNTYNNDTMFAAVRRLFKAIPKGMYVAVYSYGNMNAKLFPPDIVSLFERVGATKIKSVKDNMGYALFGRMDIGAIKEDTTSKPYNSAAYQPLVEADFYVSSKNGYVTTPKIGPTKTWRNLRWQEHPLEATQGNDSISLSIIGVSNSGVQTPIITNLSKDSVYVNLLGRINAATYPYIILQAHLRDSTLRTPPQINKWRVFYDPAPELALNPNKFYSFYKDSLDEGDILKLNVAVENISDVPADSVKIISFISRRNKGQDTLFNKHFKPLQPSGSSSGSDTVLAKASKNTRGYAGANYLWIDANPFLNGKYDQPEQNHTNNVMVLPFYVKPDKTNPLLDVTFDGVHILDKDIVSPKPEILIRLKDNSKFLALKDTSTFRMWVFPPGQTDVDKYRLYFRNQSPSALRFTPAQLPGMNAAEINYKPVFTQDGIYTLMVEATDASKNESGKYNYRITFEVINKSTITEVLNYPNPFTNSTRFVFVLTGAEIPAQMKIQIMTISGKIVREITQSEIGPIHIGRNITEYAWDGRDEYGDQLATGVYIYRVLTNIRGQAVEQRATAADKYFVRGYGKMYLLR